MNSGAGARSRMPISSDDVQRPPPYLAAQGVTAGYGKTRVIFDIDVAVGQGEVVAIVGPNGAGKSTLLKTLTGLLQPLTGNIALAGQDVTGHTPDELARKSVGYVPQTEDVFDNLTVRENLKMGGYLLKRRQLQSRIDQVVADLPLLDGLLNRAAHKLSGGERKLTAIGRAMMLDPRVLILDEPTAGLAPVLADDLLKNQIARLAAGDRGVVLVEQKARAALSTANWGYVLVAGRVRYSAQARKLLADEDLAAAFFGASVERENRSSIASHRDT
jgi:branched-chain amino acid transport system ATP-binding protein